jgi:hypothetical protein
MRPFIFEKCFLQELVDDQLIVHASGNRKHRFVQGFYFYYIVEDKKGKCD